jgi:hypothetical protein
MTSLNPLRIVESGKAGEYGARWFQALGKGFWIGWLCGSVTITGALLGILFLLHGLHVTGSAFYGRVVVYVSAGWAIAFLMDPDSREPVEKARGM